MHINRSLQSDSKTTVNMQVVSQHAQTPTDAQHNKTLYNHGAACNVSASTIERKATTRIFNYADLAETNLLVHTVCSGLRIGKMSVCNTRAVTR